MVKLSGAANGRLNFGVKIGHVLLDMMGFVIIKNHFGIICGRLERVM